MRRRRRRRRGGVLGNGKGSLDILCGGMNSVECFPGQNEVIKRSTFNCDQTVNSFGVWTHSRVTRTITESFSFFLSVCEMHTGLIWRRCVLSRTFWH